MLAGALETADLEAVERVLIVLARSRGVRQAMELLWLLPSEASARAIIDPQPHPNDPTPAATFPHHKHEPPDIKYHRKPATGITFDWPKLPKLIVEISQLS